MTARLTATLTEIASQAPEILPPDDLWRRGRRQRRRRRLRAAALACLAALASLLLVVPVPAPRQHAGDGGLTLPATVAQPYLWQAKLSASPNGPALLVFRTLRSISGETAYVIVGRDGSYRMVYPNVGHSPGQVSPDGRYLLGETVLDLETGRTRSISPDRRYSDEWVWAADSRHAVGVSGEDQIILADVQEHTDRVLTIPRGIDPMVSITPDGTRVAVFTDPPGGPNRLLILDVASGRELLDVQLSDDLRLAGPAAWTPDGSELLLSGGLGAPGCLTQACQNERAAGAPLRWRLQRISAVSGAVLADETETVASTREVVGWRDGSPVVQEYQADSETCRLIMVTAPGTEHVLPLRVPHRCPDIPADVLATAAFGGPGIGPSVWPVQTWFAVLLLVAAGGLVLTGYLIGRRLRRRRTAVRQPKRR